MATDKNTFAHSHTHSLSHTTSYTILVIMFFCYLLSPLVVIIYSMIIKYSTFFDHFFCYLRNSILFELCTSCNTVMMLLLLMIMIKMKSRKKHEFFARIIIHCLCVFGCVSISYRVMSNVFSALSFALSFVLRTCFLSMVRTVYSMHVFIHTQKRRSFTHKQSYDDSDDDSFTPHVNWCSI